MTTINSFNGLIEFAALAEAGTYTLAAKRLEVSTSHISRAVAALEERLGVKLVNRTTRHTSLTMLGQEYYQHTKLLLDTLDTANSDVSGAGATLSGTVRISMAGHFCDHYVAPVLAAFAAKHEDIRFELDVNVRRVDFVNEGVDFAIRFGPMPESNLIARKLANQRRVAVASRKYLEKRGTPQHPDELMVHDCIMSATNIWGFNVEGEEKLYQVNGRFQATSQPSILAAMEAGLGIAYMPARSFGNRLGSPDYVQLLSDYTSVELYSWIVYPDRRHLMARARKVADYLLDHFKEWR